MYTEVTEERFIAAFNNIEPHGFSEDGLRALFDHFESYEAATGERLELDPIAIRCAFSEDTLENVLAEYDYKDSEELYQNCGFVAFLPDDNIVYQVC